MTDPTIDKTPIGTYTQLPFSKVTRVEVIDENGRSYVNWNKHNKVHVELQDNGRTLKVFITQ
jgi:hypothetical protein